LEIRLGEDLAVSAWALAANSGHARELESILAEAFRLCDGSSKSVSAGLHYHAGRAYQALQMRDRSQEHFRQAAELDPQGVFGRMAR
jgi:tetratricopeptide (TPR) repeat protein